MFRCEYNHHNNNNHNNDNRNDNNIDNNNKQQQQSNSVACVISVSHQAELSIRSITATNRQKSRSCSTTRSATTPYFMYVVESGELRIEVNGEDSGRCSAGQTFGEMALIYGSQRAATLTTMCPTRMWTIHR